MIPFLVRTALSNVCLSLVLAIAALVVQATARRPPLAYLLWLFVFVKLLTPPLVTIPVFPIPGPPASAVASESADSQFGSAGLWGTLAPLFHGNGNGRSGYGAGWPVILAQAQAGLVFIWLLGSALVLAWSLERAYRFNRLLKGQSTVAPPELQAVAARLSERIGLRAAPTIHTTSAHLSPMVWWIGGQVRIIVPAALAAQMETRQFQWILAHELAHVRRRDYLVRWLEWLVCVCFWWNPVVYWARHNLRVNEEICCDALVVGRLQPEPHAYAESLLTAVEYLAGPVIRPPAIASEINSGGQLERRFKMIVSCPRNRKTSRWLQTCILLGAVVVLPLGVAYAQDQKVNSGAAETRVRAAVASGTMTPAEGRAKLQSLTPAKAVETPKADLSVAETRIRAAVTAGKMTPAEGRAKLQALKQAKAVEAPKADLSVAETRIRAAVTAGKMTPAEGRAKLQALKQAKAVEAPKADLSVAETRIRTAVASGKMTPAEGRAKLQALKQAKAVEAPKANGGKPETPVK